ncbi:CRISPR-associated endonuclease Cas1, partial [Candidatus Aerophobetes bacterium]|nr:CRISPR-associated endonuclease Cas1 [Candidatus Aerophobetes bacterium]
MTTVYLTEQGTVLRKKSRRLVVTKGKEVIKEIPAFKIERVLIFGNIQITTQTLSFLLQSGIETSFLSLNGKFRGRLAPLESKNVFLRIAQYERYLDNHFATEHAKKIVEAKIKNCRTVVRKYSSIHPEVDFAKTLKTLDELLIRLSTREKVATILGIEGQATAVYFRAFGKMCRRDLQFLKRTRRPPKDEVNALLSFGYTLITNEIFSILSAIGFDSYIGYLHGINYGRPSLALDMVEEFRQPVIDRFTLKLINKKIFTTEDFEEKEKKGM